MSRSRKFAKQAANGRRPFTSNLRRALSGLNLAVVSADEPTIYRPATETIQDKVARLRKHLAVYENDGAARQRLEELTGLPFSATETQIGSRRGPELIGFGGGSGGWPEVRLPVGPEELRLSEEDWLILAQAASFGALGK